jgi:hypothetical protein
VKTNDIVGAWLAGASIWALSMLGLVLTQPTDTPPVQAPPSQGIMVEDWYAQGFPGEIEANLMGEPDWERDWDDPSDRPRSTFLPPLPSPGRQQGSYNQQDDQASRQ